MKQINYSGSSKLISRIVHLLNRKAPLPLDGDGDPSWGTNGQVLSTDGNGNTAWVNQGGGGDVTDVEVNGTSVVNAQGVAEVSVPTKTSDLNNDSDFVSDASYVHTDENFTSTEKTKLGGIAAGAEVNVQADWNETDNTSDAYIANKPTIPAAQIQSDWNQTDTSAVDYIKNKPTGSGHTIWNAIKTALTQRTKLWFADAKVTDDSTEQATKVEVVQLIDDESELTNAPDGVYQGDYEDAPEYVLDASMMAYRNGSVEDALDDLNEAKIFYKDIPIAGLQLSNYYINVNTNVNPNKYTAIGISDVAGAWDENLVFRINTANTLRVLNMRTATYTVPSIYQPIRVYFVKSSNVSATPLS